MPGFARLLIQCLARPRRPLPSHSRVPIGRRHSSSSPFFTRPFFGRDDIPQGFDDDTFLFLVLSSCVAFQIWGDHLNPKLLYNRLQNFRKSTDPSPSPSPSPSATEDSSSSSLAEVRSSSSPVEPNQLVHNGAQRYKVTVVSEGSDMKTAEVLCQIGLKGIYMLDLSTSEPLSFIHLGSITSWKVNDPSVITIWVNDFLDDSPRQIRLHSSTDVADLLYAILATESSPLKEREGEERHLSTVAQESGKATERQEG